MSLQQYHKMNVGWTDASGNVYDGTPNGPVINNVDQPFGTGCGDFDGFNDDLSFSTYFDPSGLSQFSIDGWLKHRTGGALPNDGIWGHIGVPGTRLYLHSNTAAEGLQIGIGLVVARATVDISSEWIYFAMRFNGDLIGDANRLKLRVGASEEVLTFGATVPAVLPTMGGAPKIGNLGGLTNYWNGLFNDIALYDHALTQAEIDFRWNGGAGREIGSGGNMRKKRLMEMYNA